nr:hypothetical protein [uncultured Dysosmobacter sp.]
MSEELNPTQQQTQDPTPGASGGERTFTQDEVNRIVSDRLAREREKLTGQAKKDEREKALEAREARLDCREYLDTKGYPAALLEVLDSSDTAKFKAAADKLVELFPGLIPEKQQPAYSGLRLASPNKGGNPDNINDRLAAAFRPKI